MEQATLDAFRSLFKGRDDVWGGVEGRSNKEAVEEKHYQLHLKGERSLGIYPLLDDGTCFFAAVDLDEKDLNKAMAVRKALKELGITAYIAESKSKGYHVYVFAETRFLAKDIRWVLHSTLQKIGVTAEIFPKQDKLDEVIKYGNYINLPYFGMSRQFVTASNTKLSLEMAHPKIVRTTEAVVTMAVASLPPESPQMVPQAVPKVKTGKKIHPPCILKILKGVGQGQRDVAAFALARHYLDQMYLLEEVFALLMQWDRSNRPPINDMRVLQTKLQSAEKGYHFGCASIMDEPLLAGFCPGKDKCDWLIEIDKDKKKKGLMQETSFYENETHIFEEIIENGKAIFIAYNKNTHEISKADSVNINGIKLVPAFGAEIIEGAVRLPTGIEEYNNTKQLVKDITAHIQKFDDLKPRELEFTTWYVLMTWTYDKLPNVQYLRFKGDIGTGKSRSLDTVGDLCYKPMMLSGAVTPAPIYRIIKKFRGTLILDEADFNESDEKSEVVTILNCGYERGRPILRCSKDNPDELQVLPCFGPKIFATRKDFEDKALESRCMTIEMLETTRDDIPAYLGKRYQAAVMKLRNQLLLYRLRNYSRVDPDAAEDIDLGPVEPRLKQTGIPYAISFKDDPEIMDRYKAFIYDRNQDLIQQRADSAEGRVLYAFLKIASTSGKQYVTAGAIQRLCQDELKLDLKSQTIGKILGSLGIKSTKKRQSGTQAHYYNWRPEVMKSLRKRYFPDEEFEDLFEDGTYGTSENESVGHVGQ